MCGWVGCCVLGVVLVGLGVVVVGWVGCWLVGWEVGWVMVGWLVGQGLHHQSYHTQMHTTQHQRIFSFCVLFMVLRHAAVLSVHCFVDPRACPFPPSRVGCMAELGQEMQRLIADGIWSVTLLDEYALCAPDVVFLCRSPSLG